MRIRILKVFTPPFVLFVASTIYLLASLIAAMWKSRWVARREKGVEPTLPPLYTRIWRLMRFTFAYNILPVLGVSYVLFFDLQKMFYYDKEEGYMESQRRAKIVGTGGFIIFPILTCIIGLVYAYWGRSQQEDKKEIHGEKA